MNPLLILGLYGGALVTNYYAKRDKGLSRALELSGDKGIVNIGSGCDWSGSAMAICDLPQVVANVDVSIADTCPKCTEVNLDQMVVLPYYEGQFDVAFASHVLEHLDNWQDVLSECERVADHVIIVLPHPFSINSYFNHLHKQHFGFQDMDKMKSYKTEVYA